MCEWNCVSCIDIWCDCVFVHARRTPVRGSCDRVSNNLFFQDTSRQKGFYWGLCRAVTEAHKEENKDPMQLPNVNFTFFCVISLPVSPLPSFWLSSLSSFSSCFQWKILGYTTNHFLSLCLFFFTVPPLNMQIHPQNKQEMVLTPFVNNSWRYQNNIVKPFDSVC